MTPAPRRDARTMAALSSIDGQPGRLTPTPCPRTRLATLATAALLSDLPEVTSKTPVNGDHTRKVAQ